MKSLRLQIRDGIILGLNTGRPAGVPEATARRYLPGEPIRDPELAVFLLGESASPGGGRTGPLTVRELRGAVQARGLAFDSASPEDAVDEALRWATQVLFELPKPEQLRLLIHGIDEVGTSYEVAQGDQLYVLATLQFSVRYQTSRADLTSPS